MIRRLAAAAALFAACLAAPALAQSVSHGREIYDSICSSCHGFPPAGGPERAEGDPIRIRNAINTVPSMQFLRQVLTNADIDDVAAYLRSLNNPTPVNPVPEFDYTDLWWNPAESGWGLNLIQHSPSNKIFGVMYTYDATGKAAWYVIPDGSWSTSTVYAGAIYRVTGPPQTGSTFNSSLVRVNQVGLATLTFASRDTATFAFNIDGRAVTKTVTRQPF